MVFRGASVGQRMMDALCDPNYHEGHMVRAPRHSCASRTQGVRHDVSSHKCSTRGDNLKYPLVNEHSAGHDAYVFVRVTEFELGLCDGKGNRSRRARHSVQRSVAANTLGWWRRCGEKNLRRHEKKHTHTTLTQTPCNSRVI